MVDGGSIVIFAYEFLEGERGHILSPKTTSHDRQKGHGGIPPPIPLLDDRRDYIRADPYRSNDGRVVYFEGVIM